VPETAFNRKEREERKEHFFLFPKNPSLRSLRSLRLTHPRQLQRPPPGQPQGNDTKHAERTVNQLPV
jgi:hypothetical protein